MSRSIPKEILGPDLGIFQDRPKDAVPERGWSDGLNVRFDGGSVRTSPGWVKFTSQVLDSPVKRIDQYFKFNNTDFAVAITNGKFYYYDTGTNLWTDVTGTALGGTTDDFIDSETAFDIYMFVNNASRVRKWTGSGSTANLGGLNAAVGASGTVDVQTAKSITSFAGFVHLVNTVEDATRRSQRWRWSRFGDAEGWSNVSTYGQAGYTDITDGPDKLQVARRLGGDFLALYKERSIHIAQYVGPPTVWTRRLAVPGTGLIAPGAVADIGTEHIFIGNEDVYIFNGLNIKPIGRPIWNTFISELNPNKSHLIWAHVVLEEHEVIFAYPSGGSSVPNKAIVYNYFFNSWAFRDMPFLTMGYWRRTDASDSWDSDSDSWDSDQTRWDDTHFAENAPLHLGGDSSGYVHDYGNGYSQDGNTHSSYVVSPAINSGRPDLIKRWLRILCDLVATGSHSIEISYLGVDNKNATLNWSASRSLICDLSANPWVTMDVSGRWLFIRFRTNGTNNPYEITSYGYEHILRGRF